METGFKLIENENGVFLTYVLSGGVICKGKDTIAVAKALDNIKKTIAEQMLAYISNYSFNEEVFDDLV